MTNDWFIEFRIPAMIFSGQISVLFWTMWKAVWNESNIGFLEVGEVLESLKSIFQSNSGVVHGLQVKVRQKILADRMYALVSKPVQAVIKLSYV